MGRGMERDRRGRRDETTLSMSSSFHKTSGECGLTCCVFSDLIFFSTSSVHGSLCYMLSRLIEIIKGIMSKIVVYL